MADETQTPAADEDQGQRPEAPDEGQPETPAAEPDTVENPEAKAASDEAAKYRRQLRDAEKKLEALEKAEEERQNAELSEVDRLKKRVAELDTAKAQIEAMTAVLQEVLDQELASIPEEMHDKIQGETPQERLADLNRLRALGLFAAKPQPNAPNFNAGEQSAGKAQDEDTKLNDAQREFKARARERGYLRNKK